MLLGSAAALRRDQLGTYERAMREQGDLAQFRIGPPGIGFDFNATFHPDGAREVLTDRTDVKQAPAFTELKAMIDDGIGTANGQRWQRDRRMLQPLFTRQRAEADVPVINDATDELVAWCAEAAATGQEVDLHDVPMRHALHALGATIFGEDIDEAAPVARAAVPVRSWRKPSLGTPPGRFCCDSAPYLRCEKDEKLDAPAHLPCCALSSVGTRILTWTPVVNG